MDGVQFERVAYIWSNKRVRRLTGESDGREVDRLEQKDGASKVWG